MSMQNEPHGRHICTEETGLYCGERIVYIQLNDGLLRIH